MSKFRKFLTSTLMVMVVLGMSLITAPEVGAAAQAGDLIKMDGLSSVYYLGKDGKRYVFPSESVYFSWYSDFSGVVTISAAELQSYPLGGNITMRPGTKLVKITTDPKVYAVSPNGTLHWIQSEADAIALYGANWASMVVDVADSYFTNYTIGDPLPSGTYPAGTILKNVDGSSIYYWDGAEFRKFANEAAFVANGFNFDYVVSTTDMTWSPLGDDITGAEDQFMVDGDVDTTQPSMGGSGLTVALNAATPVSQNIPQTVSRVPFAKVNLTAAQDGAVSVDGLTITRTGLTTIGNSVKVWAEHNGDALTTKRTITNNEAILTFSPAVSVEAGQTVTLDILAELDDVSGNIALGIAGASHVSTNGATVSGSFPITGNLMSITAYDVVQLTFNGNEDDYTVTVGDVEVEVGRFDLEMGTTARDVVVDSVMLRNTGVEDLANVAMDMYLEEAGERVTEYATFDGRYATFEFLGDGYEYLEDDGLKTFVVKTDIIDKESSATSSLVFLLHRAEHLIAYEATTGFGVTYGHSNNEDVSEVEIKSGVVTVSKKSTSPADDSVIAGQNNVVALLANIKADEAIFAEGLKVNYDGDADSFRNIRVYLNNVLLDSFDLDTNQTYNGSDYETKEIDTSISLNEGDNELKITVSVRSNAEPGDQFRSQVVGTDDGLLILPEYVSNGIFVDTTEDISGQADGALFTVAGGALVVTRNDGYSDGRVLIQGNQDVLLGTFAIKAENDAIKITSIALGENEGEATTTPHTSIYDMKLYVDGNQVGNTRNFGSGGATFSSLNYEITKDTTKVFELRGSFDSSAAGSSSTYFKTELTAYGQDSTGSSVGEDSDTTAQFKIKESGSLTVDVAPNTPNSDILIAQAEVEQELAQFRFTAQDDSANITKITLANEKHTLNAMARVSSFRLYDGATLLDSIVPTAATSTFNIANNDLLVEANSNKVVTVKAVFNEIEFEDDSGAEYEFTMVDLEAKGSNGALIDSPMITLDSSNVMVLRKTKPTFVLVSGYDTAGADTEQEMLRFKISADSNEDLQVNTLTFTAGGTATGIDAVGDWGLYEVGNSIRLATSTDGSFTSLGIEIGSGTDKSFYVVVDTSSVPVDERFGVSLRNDTTGNISWKEYFVAGYGDAIDGEYLKTFPISGGTMTY